MIIHRLLVHELLLLLRLVRPVLVSILMHLAGRANLSKLVLLRRITLVRHRSRRFNLRVLMRSDRRFENFSVGLTKDNFLEAEHDLRVNDWGGLGPAAVNLLRGETLMAGLAVGTDLIRALGLGQHYSDVLFNVLVADAHGCASISRIESEVNRRLSFFVLTVEVRTMFFTAADVTVALADFEVVWMVLFLLPAVAIYAPVLQVTAVAVSLCLFLCRPESTLLLVRVLIDMRFATVVLPVMCVLTLVTHVAPQLIIKGAPDSLEMKHVEVSILLHLVQKVDAKLVFTVSEGAQVSKVATLHIIGPAIAELRFVLLRVVKGLNTVVCFETVVSVWALACLCKPTHFRRVGAQGPPPVLVVVVEALLLVVARLLRAYFCLEQSKVKKSDTFRFLGRVVSISQTSTFLRGCRSDSLGLSGWGGRRGLMGAGNLA